jgi:hypothetical protein
LPSVHHQQPSRGVYWTGALLSTSSFAASPLHPSQTLSSSEAGRSSGPNRDTIANVAAAVAHPASMHPGSDPMGAPSSFSQRRPHAAQLGSFELPPPPMHKYPFTNTVTAPQSSQAPTTIASVGNLLTPPNTLHGDALSSAGVSTSGTNPTTSIPHLHRRRHITDTRLPINSKTNMAKPAEVCSLNYATIASSNIKTHSAKG